MGALIVAMLAAIVFFVVEGRGLVLFADDWDFGFLSRTSFDATLVVHLTAVT